MANDERDWQRWLREPPRQVVSKVMMSREQYLDLLCCIDLEERSDDDVDYWLTWLYWALLHIQFAICEELRLKEPKFFDTSYIWTPADKS